MSGAQCAHSRVVLRTVRNTDGTMHEEWWCNDCVGGTRFVPMRDLESARAELDAHLAAAPGLSRLRHATEELLRRLQMGELCDGDCRPGIDEHTAGCPVGMARAALTTTARTPPVGVPVVRRPTAAE